MGEEKIKLTKKNLMAFQEGIFILSNLYENGKSIYTASVVPQDQRAKQWEEIKKVKADGRLCNIFNDEKEQQEYSASISKLFGDKMK